MDNTINSVIHSLRPAIHSVRALPTVGMTGGGA